MVEAPHKYYGNFEIRPGDDPSLYGNGSLSVASDVALGSLTRGAVTIDTISTDGTLGSSDSTLSTQQAVKTYTDTKTRTELTYEPTGFTASDRAGSSISFSDGARRFSIGPTGPSFSYYIQGTKYNKTVGLISPAIPDAEGMHYAYFEGDQFKVTPTFTDDLYGKFCYVANTYWDATNSTHLFLGDERHGFMPGTTHKYFHDTTGTEYISGLALSSITADGNGNDNIHAEMAVEAGLLQDEDIPFNITAKPFPAQIQVLYRDGVNGYWRKAPLTNAPVVTYSGGSNRLAWNAFSGGAWIQQEVSNIGFVYSHILATNDTTQMVYAIQGQNTYATYSSAVAASGEEVNQLLLAGLPMVEFVFLGSVLYQTSIAYGNTWHARIRSVNGADYVDLRQKKIRSYGAAQSHSSLSNLQHDDHLQYALLAGRTGDTLFIDEIRELTSGGGVRTGNILLHPDKWTIPYMALDVTGASDCSALIATAINAGRRLIQLPKGTLRFDNRLYVNTKSDLVIRGYGPSTIIRANNGFLDSGLIVLNSCTNVTVEQMTIDGNKASVVASSSGIHLTTGSTKCTFKFMTIHGCKNCGLLFDASATIDDFPVVRDTEVFDCDADGIRFVWGANGCHFENVRSHHNAGDGIRYYNTSPVLERSIFIGCNASSNGGIGLNFETLAQALFTIGRCVVELNTSHGIYVSNSGQCNITDCLVRGNTGDGLNLVAVYSSVVDDSIFVNNGGTGIKLVSGTSNTIKDNISAGNTTADYNIADSNNVVGYSILPKQYKYTCDFRVDGTIDTGTGITLPTSGGTQRTLDYYEYATMVRTFINLWTGSPPFPPTCSIYFTRIGKQVTLSFSTATATADTSDTHMELSVNILTRLYPVTNVYQPVVVIDNGTVTTGYLWITPSGAVSVYKTDGSSFAGAGQTGVYGASVTYRFA
jgi:parallel beta-helix repeat protein